MTRATKHIVILCVLGFATLWLASCDFTGVAIGVTVRSGPSFVTIASTGGGSRVVRQVPVRLVQPALASQTELQALPWCILGAVMFCGASRRTRSSKAAQMAAVSGTAPADAKPRRETRRRLEKLARKDVRTQERASHQRPISNYKGFAVDLEAGVKWVPDVLDLAAEKMANPESARAFELYQHAGLTHSEVLSFLLGWGQCIMEIGNVRLGFGDYIDKARDMLKNMYLHDQAFISCLRSGFEGKLFTGFASNWAKFSLSTLTVNKKASTATGSFYFTDYSGKDTHFQYTFELTKKLGKLKVLHQDITIEESAPSKSSLSEVPNHTTDMKSAVSEDRTFWQTLVQATLWPRLRSYRFTM